MILREATIKYTGYDPNTLSKGSAKRICVSCDNCGRVRYVRFNSYCNLCPSCSRKHPKQHTIPKFVSESDRFIPNTGIDRILTIKEFGYDPIDLSYGSKFNIISICQNCSKNKITSKQAYRDLCGSCGKSCKGNSQYGKPRSEIVKNKISKTIIKNESSKGKNNSMYGKTGDKSPHWTGGFNILRPYLLSESKCIKLNKRFINSEFHHITKSLGIYIPKKLHHHIWHNMRTGKNMKEINKLALQFINRKL